MSDRAKSRILVLANRDKPQVVEAMRSLTPWLEARTQVVADPDIHALSADAADDLPEADLALVLGGDGTIIGQTRNLLRLGLPMVGVNFGKLGFLAEFSLDDLKRYWDHIIDDRCRRSQRMLIGVQVHRDGDAGCAPVGEPLFESVAMNDAVITAGPPYRMIELDLAIDPTPEREPTTFTGDGVILSTPSGSTAYNLSAGGPIISPGIDALCVTPICPHSLAFRPIIVNPDCCVQLQLRRGNEGTTLVIDGQVPRKLAEGDLVVVRRHPQTLELIHNPRINYWHMLASKLHWAARPRNT